MDAKDRKPVPPYVAYKTLSNFLDRFKQGLPGRIDRGLMGSMSGAAQSQVTTALRYLGMISENNIPTALMRRYVSGQEQERQAALFEMLTKSYPFIFGGDFNLATATASQLREEFADNTTATGETLGRCMAFLKDAALDAGIIVSPFILQKKTRNPVVKKRSAAPSRDEKSPDRAAKESSPLPQNAPALPAFPAQASLLLSGLFQRLPRPGTVWAKDDRERWVQTLNNVLLLEYPEYDGTS
jgi:Family of unknown function (DUF5343)